MRFALRLRITDITECIAIKANRHRAHHAQTAESDWGEFNSCCVTFNSFSAAEPSDTNTQDSKLRPNIVVIVFDDMDFSDIGCDGSEIGTPPLDRLAANGIRFVDFHNNAKCSETRASVMTPDGRTCATLPCDSTSSTRMKRDHCHP